MEKNYTLNDVWDIRCKTSIEVFFYSLERFISTHKVELLSLNDKFQLYCYISELAMTVIIFLVVNNLWQKVSVYKNQIDSPQCLLRVRKYLILHTALRVLSPCNGFPIIHNFCRYRNKLTRMYCCFITIVGDRLYWNSQSSKNISLGYLRLVWVRLV